MESSVLVVLVMAPPGEGAAALARSLVEERLAACVNLIPGARSIYRWEGAVLDEPEQLLVIKTTAERYAALEARVRALHGYQVPEIIALPVERGLAAYLAWVREQTGPGPG
jgi:periplasmic divalent cation tolerance protein